MLQELYVLGDMLQHIDLKDRVVDAIIEKLNEDSNHSLTLEGSYSKTGRRDRSE